MIVIIVIIKQLFFLQRTSLSFSSRRVNLFLTRTRAYTHALSLTHSLTHSFSVSLSFLSRSFYSHTRQSMRTHYSLSSSSFFFFRSYNFVSFILLQRTFFFFYFLFFNSYFEGLRGSGRLATTFFFSCLSLPRDTGTIVRSFFSFFFFLRLRVFNTVYRGEYNALTDDAHTPLPPASLVLRFLSLYSI